MKPIAAKAGRGPRRTSGTADLEPDATVLLDPALKILATDNRLGALLEDAREMVGRPLDAFVPEVSTWVRERLEAGDETGRLPAQPRGGPLPPSAGRWAFRRMRGPAGETLAVVLTLETSPAGSAATIRYRALFDNHPQPMWVYDLQTLAFLAVNDAAIHKYGYRRDEFLRMTIADIRPPEDVPALVANVERVGAGLDEAGIWRHRTRAGALIDVEIVSHTLVFAGRPAELVMATDVTERRRLERERRQAFLEAQAALRTRDDFLSTASHELRTPLAALQLIVQGLLRSLAPSAEALTVSRSRLLAMERQTRRMTALVDALLDVSRLNRSGGLASSYEPLDLAALCRECALRLSDTFSRAGSPLQIEAPVPVVGHWDRMGLDLVATNLLSNAAKYGAGKPVQLAVFESDGRAVLRVRDHGIGIAPEDHQRIFGRFERAVSTNHFAGLGLGLWISHQVVERLGGSIQVESAVGHGTTFLVTLPLRPSEQLAPALPLALEPAPAP